MTISANIVADTISPEGIRLTSFQLRYPRFIHAELMTHRVFSRSSSSSRAIPVKRLIEDVRRDPVYPMHWGKNQKGMQAQQENDSLVYLKTSPALEEWGYSREEAWDIARERAIEMARAFHEAGYHKQIVNRLLEPFSHINVVVTATDFNNWFRLRAHPDAQPEIRILAEEMWAAREESEPGEAQHGDWHMPYIKPDDIEVANLLSDNPLNDLLAVSTARCARVSYYTHDGRDTSFDEDLNLYQRLVGSDPKHASPSEHQATPDRLLRSFWTGPKWENPQWHGNFRGWIQHRKLIPEEAAPETDPQ